MQAASVENDGAALLDGDADCLEIGKPEPPRLKLFVHQKLGVKLPRLRLHTQPLRVRESTRLRWIIELISKEVGRRLAAPAYP